MESIQTRNMNCWSSKW